MQCNCGGSTIFYSHEVKSLDKAREWHPNTAEEDLPVTIRRDECTACGRYRLLPLRK